MVRHGQLYDTAEPGTVRYIEPCHESAGQSQLRNNPRLLLSGSRRHHSFSQPPRRVRGGGGDSLLKAVTVYPITICLGQMTRGSSEFNEKNKYRH